MDQKFQTSFIPKKPVFSQNGGTVSKKPAQFVTSIFMLIAIIMLIASIGAVGGAYVWKLSLLQDQVSYKKQLEERKNSFDLRSIEQLKLINVQIDTAKKLLNGHIAMSQLFGIIEQMTVSKIRFISMDVNSPTSKTSSASIDLKGYGTNLSAVAFQSDVLGKLAKYNLQNMVKNPIISDPVLDMDGKVSFGFSANIDPGSLSYAKSITGSDSTSASSTSQ